MTREIPWKDAQDGDIAVLNIGETEIRLPVHGYPTGRTYVNLFPKFILPLDFLHDEMDVLVRVERAQRELPTKIGSVIRRNGRYYVRVNARLWVRSWDAKPFYDWFIQDSLVDWEG